MASVLVIDDDPLQQMIAREALRARHNVTCVGDANEALALLRTGGVDVVVCDVVMPGMNGYQFLACLRADPALAATPLILLTSMGERAQMRAGMEAGADDYIVKPYYARELQDAVEAVLQRRRTQQAAAAAALQQRFVAALRRQEMLISERYERRLAQELSARWDRDSGSGDSAEISGATLLLANLFGALGVEGSAGTADMGLHAFQAARDSLYLFGALHVLPYGELLLAVFDAGRDEQSPAGLRALRAAQALHSAVALAGASGTPLSVAVQGGDVTLIQLRDALHGDAGCAVLPGRDMRALRQLLEGALDAGWRCAVPADVLPQLPAEVGTPGREAQWGDVDAVELLLPNG